MIMFILHLLIKTLNNDTHIVNIYDWLSNFKLHNFNNVETDNSNHQLIRIKIIMPFLITVKIV